MRYGYFDDDKQRDRVEVHNVNWNLGVPPSTRSLEVKLRHSDYSYGCELHDINKNSAKLKLDTRDQGIAAGQFVAFYDGQTCLGSAVIK